MKNKLLMIVAGCAASIALSAQAQMTFDFNDGGMQGFENIMVSSAAAGYYDAYFGPSQTFGRDGWGGGPNPAWHTAGSGITQGNEIPNAGLYILTTMPFDAQKGTVNPWSAWPDPSSGVHQTLMVASPAFTLQAGALSYMGAGGSGGGGAILNSLSQVPAVGGTWGSDSGNDNSTRGNGQVSLMDESGNFVLSKQFTQSDWSTYTWSAAELEAYVGGTYKLVVIDWLAGQSAIFAIDNVSIPGVASAWNPVSVPEPSTFALLGLGGLALMFRRRK